jgi:signal transduction histidine kinase
MDRAGTAHVWRALSVVAVVAVCLVLAVVAGETVLGPAVGPLLAPFAGAGLAAGVLALMARGRDDDHAAPGHTGRSALVAATAPTSLDALVAVLREGTGAAHAEVWLVVPDGLAAQSGPDRVATTTDLLLRADVDHALPVVDDGELRAVLTVGKPGRPVTAADRALVTEIGAGARLLLRVVARGAELRARVARADELARETEESRRRLGRARELERHRLVSELGGATTERLAGFRVAVTAAAESVDEGLEEPEDDPARAEAAEFARHHLTTARERLEELLDRFRVIARGVHPAVLRDQGPRAALEEVVADLPRAVHLTGRLPQRLPWEVESGLYYAAAAALALLGGRAGEEPLELALEQAGDDAEVRVTDATADPDATRAALADDADRLAALGGSLELTTDDGGRTVLRARLPTQLRPLVEAGLAG